MDDETRVELERRLALIEDPEGHDAPFPPLPRVDLAAAVAGLVLISLLLLWWAL
jgi:hypothetical protein